MFKMTLYTHSTHFFQWSDVMTGYNKGSRELIFHKMRHRKGRVGCHNIVHVIREDCFQTKPSSAELPQNQSQTTTFYIVEAASLTDTMDIKCVNIYSTPCWQPLEFLSSWKGVNKSLFLHECKGVQLRHRCHKDKLHVGWTDSDTSSCTDKLNLKTSSVVTSNIQPHLLSLYQTNSSY